jgi:hypothetical protein
VVFRGTFRLSDYPVLQYELVPGAADGSVHISAAGLRDREYATPKPAGVFRVLVIGDSIAYGFGVARSDVLSAQLAALLQAAAASTGAQRRFEVLNLGVPGYNIEQVVENARVRGLPFQPDAIVYAYCLNDPQAYSFELESLKALLSPAGAAYRAHAARAQPALAERSRLWLLLRYALHAFDARPAAVKDAEWAALRSGDYAGYFEQLYRAPDASASMPRCKRAGVPIAVAIFPVFEHLDAYPLAQLHRDVAGRFAVRGLAAHDLLPMYAAAQRAYGPVFVHNALHPNAIGDRMAALYLLRALAHAGQLGPDLQRLDLDALTAKSKVDHAFVQLIDQTYGGAKP